MKAVVFDLGGTLMEYTGMPASWVGFYRRGFEAVRQASSRPVSEEDLERSVRLLTEFNPRVCGRVIEYSPEFIFSKVLAHWHTELPLERCIRLFWQGLKLRARLYPDSLDVLKKLKDRGYALAALTDLPSAMPDELFRKDIPELLGCLDCYVSSAVAGYRKPGPRGLQKIAGEFSLPVAELTFVGDEEKDKKTAENASCRFIGIRRGGTEKGEGISSLYELLEILN